MATREIGIRIDMEKGVAFFGVEEVNQLIVSGARLVEIRPGGALMTETGSSEENRTLTLSGCQFQLVFADS
jgi:hypothetical protein